jgi:trehalose 6-phosphate phosphatase
MTDAPPAALDLADHAFFLDLDGTLAPLVSRPELAEVPARTRQLLGRLQEQTGGAVAVISGRPLAQINALLEPGNFPAGGSHGAEIQNGTEIERVETGALAEVAAELKSFAARHDLLMEDKPGALALHYRDAPQHAEEAKEFIDRLVNGQKALRALHGKMVSEIGLAGTSKGAALERLMALPAFAERRPVMIGDDKTDEDGFLAAQRLGGAGIKIGEGQTAARHRLPGTEALADWFEALCKTGVTE